MKSLEKTYRGEFVNQIFRIIKAGDSCSMVGASGMGKSRLCHHLLDNSTREKFLESKSAEFIFIYFDYNLLNVDVTPLDFFEHLTSQLITSTEENHSENDFNTQKLRKISVESEGVGISPQKSFVQTLHFIATNSKLKFVFIFDQFDNLYKNFDCQVFANLRAVRDLHKYKISYIVFSRSDLTNIRNELQCEEFFELLQPNIIGLGPYNKSDSLDLIKNVSNRYVSDIRKSFRDMLFEITGGHPGLLKASCMELIKEGKKNFSSSSELLQFLIEKTDVKTECNKLWDSLDGNEQSYLQKNISVLQGHDSKKQSSLKLKKIVTTSGNLFSPLFELFISDNLPKSSPQITIRSGLVRIDLAGDVWIGEDRIDPPLTASELRLLTYFCGKSNQLCTKDELFLAIAPDKYARGEIISDEAIAAHIRRLRKRIESDPSKPEMITTIRGKGYLFRG